MLLQSLYIFSPCFAKIVKLCQRLECLTPHRDGKFPLPGSNPENARPAPSAAPDPANGTRTQPQANGASGVKHGATAPISGSSGSTSSEVSKTAAER